MSTKIYIQEEMFDNLDFKKIRNIKISSISSIKH